MTRILAKSSTPKRRVHAFSIGDVDAPTEMQLWNAGDNPTDYGVHVWNDRSVKEVLERYNARGNPLLIDVEHNGAALDDGEPAVTGGYAKLDIRDGAPWLTFDWSDFAVGQIASRQRLFLSPEYDVDPNTNEITALYRVSLVADPGTHRARVLASAATGNQETTNMDPTLAAIMAVLSTVEDPAAAVAAVKDLVANMASDAPANDVVDPPAADPQPAFAAADDKSADDKKVAATAPEAPKPAPVTAAAPALIAPVVDDTVVRASAANALAAEHALRDILLEKSGNRLAPSIRTWASSQPLAVVKGLLASAPEATAPPAKISATRGAGHGTGPVGKGLQGAELEELQRGMGTFKTSTPKEPFHKSNGDFVLPTLTPTEHRQRIAAQAAKGGAK